MHKSLSALLLLLVFLCIPLHADTPPPQKTLAFFMGYQGAEDKPYPRLVISTVNTTDPKFEKWAKDLHFKQEPITTVAITAAEMEKIIASLKKPEANAAPIPDTYRLFLLEADGTTTDFQILYSSILPLFRAIIQCDIPEPTRNQLRGYANRFP